MQVAETFTTEFGAVFDQEELGELSEEDKAVLVDVYVPLLLVSIDMGLDVC